MDIQIQNTGKEDIPAIFLLYDDAIAYQKKVGNNHWLGFETELVEKEIEEKRHYKIVADGKIVSTFCVTFSDPFIWKDSDITPAIYIHRIATSQFFRGNNLLKHIINWAKLFAKENNITYIRMDTGAGNDRLINYYINNGFSFIENISVDHASDLPEHYKAGQFALLQMTV
jgi:GNAT superfamily N-acetyltransferase